MKFIDINNLKKFWDIVSSSKQDKISEGEPGCILKSDGNGGIIYGDKYVILKSSAEYLMLDKVDPNTFYLIEEEAYDPETE